MNVVSSFIAYLIQNPASIANELALAGELIEHIMGANKAGTPVSTASVLAQFVEHPLASYLQSLAAQTEMPVPPAAPAVPPIGAPAATGA
jgi:hypothetical protein